MKTKKEIETEIEYLQKLATEYFLKHQHYKKNVVTAQINILNWALADGEN